MGWFGKRRKKKEKEPEGAQVEEQVSVPTGPELLVLVPEVAGAPTFQVNRFRACDEGVAFVRSVSPELLSSAHVFWALHEGPPPGIDPAGGEALVLIRAAAGRESVHVVSFIDLESAESFARFEVKRDLDLAFVMIYWAAFCQLVETPFGLGIDPPRPPDTRQWRAAQIAAAHAAPAAATRADQGPADTQMGDGYASGPARQPEPVGSTPLADPSAALAHSATSSPPPAVADIAMEREPVAAVHEEIVTEPAATQGAAEVDFAAEVTGEPGATANSEAIVDQPVTANEPAVTDEPELIQRVTEPDDIATEPTQEEILIEEPVTETATGFEPLAPVTEEPAVIDGSEAIADLPAMASEPDVTAEPAPVQAASEREDFVAEPLHEEIASQPEVIAESEPIADLQSKAIEKDVTTEPLPAQPATRPEDFVAERPQEETAAREPEAIAESDAIADQPTMAIEEDVTTEPLPAQPATRPEDFVAERPQEETAAREPEAIAESDAIADQLTMAIEEDVTSEPELRQTTPEAEGFVAEPLQEEIASWEPDVIAESEAPVDQPATASEPSDQILEEPPQTEAIELPSPSAAGGGRAVDEATEDSVAAQEDGPDSRESPEQITVHLEVSAAVEDGSEDAHELEKSVPTSNSEQDSEELADSPSELAAEVQEVTPGTNGHHADEPIPEEPAEGPIVSTEGDEEVAERLLTEALGDESRAGGIGRGLEDDQPVVARAQFVERFRMMDVSQPVPDDANASEEEDERKPRKGKKKKERAKAKASAKGKSRRNPSGDSEEEEEVIPVDVNEMIEKTLRVKRWTKQDEPFKGFDSPPGRF